MMRLATLLASGSVLAFALAGAAAAQTQPSPSTGSQGGESRPAEAAAAAAAGQTDARGLPLPPLPNGDKATAAAPAAVGEVIVTAQRRSQRLQQAPVAVTALSPQALEQSNVRSTQDLMQVVPGLQTATQTAGDSGGSATFFLRGMGQERSGNGSEPAVGVYVDDFYYPSLSGTLFKIVDLAQVEVLRGPQGTLFGRNTIGGAIRYTSQSPKLDTFSGNLTGTVGSYDRYDVTGAVNIPLGDIAAVRITAGHLQQDGFVKVQTGGPDAGRTVTDLIRVQARIEPTKNLYIELSGQVSQDKLSGFPYNIPGPNLTPAGTLPATYNLVFAPRFRLPVFNNTLTSQCFYCQPGTDRTEFSRTSYKNALATLGYDFGNGLSVKSLTGYQRVDNIASADLDGTIAQIFAAQVQHTVTEAFSQELQLNGRLFDNRLNFVAGGYYYNEKIRPQFSILPQIGVGLTSFQPLTSRETTSFAGFFDASYKLTEKLSLLGGYRYSNDDKNIRTFSQPTGATVATRAGSFDSSTFRAGLQYQWTRDIFSYADVSTGFRAGGFNPFNTIPLLSFAPFAPETATSYEVGLRTQFFDRRVTINPTVFYVDWSNIQIQSVVIDPTVTPPTGGPVLQNAGAARSYGFELEYAFQPVRDFRIFGSLSYLNIRYTSILAGTGLTTANDLQRAPPVTFALGGSYTMNLARWGKAVTTLNYSFEDDQQSAPKSSLLLPSYSLLSGRIEYTPPNAPFTISLFATNLLEEHYFVGGVDYTGIVGSPHYDLGRPREVGVTFKARF